MPLPTIYTEKKNKNEAKSAQKSSEKNISCNLCEVRFTQRKALYVHLRNKHNIEPLEKKEGKVKCPECKNTFYDKYNLKRHCRTAHGATLTRDDKRIILRGRILDISRKPKFIQNIESNYFSNNEQIQSGSSFRDETQFGTTSIEEFTCDTCQTTFTTKLGLLRHISDVHTEFQNLRCAECYDDFPNKQSLLMHTHQIEKYGILEEILPETFKYEVDQHVQINNSSFVSEIYCNLSNREDADRWLDKFQRKNKVNYRRMRRQCQSFDESYVLIIDRYRCQHNTLPKRRSIPHAKHTGCSATLFIRVYQHKNIPQLSWARIRIKHTHNHLTEAAAKFRDPVEEVVNKFHIMFQAGKGPKAALNEHIRDVQLTYGDDIISDRGICPTSRWVYNFYQKLTKQRMESSESNAASMCLKADAEIPYETYAEPVNSSLALSTCKAPNFDRLPDISKQIFYEFDQVISQIRCRVSNNPVYFLNGMKNFIQTYDATLHSQSSLNSALYSFGKHSEFQMNQLLGYNCD